MEGLEAEDSGLEARAADSVLEAQAEDEGVTLAHQQGKPAESSKCQQRRFNRDLGRHGSSGPGPDFCLLRSFRLVTDRWMIFLGWGQIRIWPHPLFNHPISST